MSDMGDMGAAVTALQGVVDEALQGVNTTQPGRLEGYDAATRRATVRPSMAKRQPDGGALAPPPVHAVPVMFPTGMGGRAGLTWPMAAGDALTLHHTQRSLEGFLSGDDGAPDDPRMFDLTDVVAVPGSFGGSANPDDVELFYGDAKFSLKPDGSAKLETAGGTLTVDAAGNWKLTGVLLEVDLPVKFNQKVDIGADLRVNGKLVNGHTHTGDSGGITGPM